MITVDKGICILHARECLCISVLGICFVSVLCFCLAYWSFLLRISGFSFFPSMKTPALEELSDSSFSGFAPSIFNTAGEKPQNLADWLHFSVHALKTQRGSQHYTASFQVSLATLQSHFRKCLSSSPQVSRPAPTSTPLSADELISLHWENRRRQREVAQLPTTRSANELLCKYTKQAEFLLETRPPQQCLSGCKIPLSMPVFSESANCGFSCINRPAKLLLVPL